jgi:hypothetical protein
MFNPRLWTPGRTWLAKMPKTRIPDFTRSSIQCDRSDKRRTRTYSYGDISILDIFQRSESNFLCVLSANIQVHDTTSRLSLSVLHVGYFTMISVQRSDRMDNWKGSERKRQWSNGGTEKNYKNFNEDRTCPDRDSKGEPPEYKSSALTLDQTVRIHTSVAILRVWNLYNNITWMSLVLLLNKYNSAYWHGS